ncbi:endonuclease/exonuclease/phosphatase family protein [Streptomyces mangrovisoli]|uniref:Endonuclease/exonuclease/phosphatase domain-containing protein n=1 Tax=Streptomyces mangrovisoli TaxID=1428628 RepID=A0A1J4P304_9ACTN|nr:endonuclease/exonuclease/phosphatase family protein [Streptomyces mangrovisoli]OIJ68132.1 hypothetical protein WN71_010105 [Streptomyces mangrovisoli]
MRWATFNILHGRRLDSRGRPVPDDGTDPRTPLAEAVAALDADVLALQEVDRLQPRSGRADQAAVAAAAMGAKDWRYASALHARGVTGLGWVPDSTVPGLRVYGPGDDADAATQVPSHGVALLSRLAVREWRALRLPPAPVGFPLAMAGQRGLSWVRDQPRAALAAVLEGPHGPFTAVALHLSFVPGWNIRQLVAVRRWVAALPRPHVLLGDFNLVGTVPAAVLNSAEFRARRGRSDGATGPSGRLRWRDAGRPATFPAHRPLVQFDHILIAGAGTGSGARSDGGSDGGSGAGSGTRSEAEAAAGRPLAVHGVRTPVSAVSDHRALVAEWEPVTP